MTEFHNDGALVERLASGESINGRYSLRGTQLSVELESGDELSFSIALAADSLALTDANGQVAQYSRVQ